MKINQAIHATSPVLHTARVNAYERGGRWERGETLLGSVQFRVAANSCLEYTVVQNKPTAPTSAVKLAQNLTRSQEDSASKQKRAGTQHFKFIWVRHFWVHLSIYKQHKEQTDSNESETGDLCSFCNNKLKSCWVAWLQIAIALLGGMIAADCNMIACCMRF